MKNTTSEKKILQAAFGKKAIEKVLFADLANECKKRAKPGQVLQEFTGPVKGSHTRDKKALLKSVKNAARYTHGSELGVLATQDYTPEELELALCALFYGNVYDDIESLYSWALGHLAAQKFGNKTKRQEVFDKSRRIYPVAVERLEKRIQELEVLFADEDDRVAEALLESFVWWVNNTGNRFFLAQGQVAETVFQSAVYEYYQWLNIKMIHPHIMRMMKKLSDSGWGVRSNPDWGANWLSIRK